ncbi:MAG: hypothetical protein JW984_00035 [Deltaproteobacteria bacterium]|uniref:Uncharacterized protein n=1 Tax=Candidatus Zymogenus saltonus TaxID=2844893 RepID=A0A9D8K8I3_9DELT|nr:hypothetical protein [Candidatus Zymogenus saltonus]
MEKRKNFLDKTEKYKYKNTIIQSIFLMGSLAGWLSRMYREGIRDNEEEREEMR